MKERMYSYQQMELIAMMYANKVVAGVLQGVYGMPDFGEFLPDALKVIEDEINQKTRVSKQVSGYQRAPDFSEGAE